MRRKLFALILCVSLVLSFAACRHHEEASGSVDISSSEQSEPQSALDAVISDTESESSIETSGESANAAGNANGSESGTGSGNSTGNRTESGTTGTSSNAGGLKVVGTRLCDSAGNPIQLRGISTHGLAWYPDYVNRACFQELRDNWNVNVIRLAMYTAEYGGYCSGGDQAALKALISNGVDYATELGMYVIIDWHILSDGNPNTHKAEAIRFFDEMSKKYAGHSNVLYEICNEPNGSATWSDVKSYAKEVIPAIRANDPDALILVGTPNWCQYVDQAAADPITGYDNIMYTLHFYADTHRDDLRNRMEAAVKAGLPIFVSEYGICDASGSGAINAEQADLWIKTLDRLGVSYVAWNLSNKSETSAIFQSSCTKTSGFTAGDLSNSGKWLYEMLTGQHATAAPTTQPNSGSGSSSTSAPEPSKSTGKMDWSATLLNSWEADGTTCYQYTLTLTNNTGAACTAWAVEIPFQGTITLSDGWNGNFSVRGNTLYITSKDYNGSVAAGDTVSDVGFIIKGGQIKS